MTRKTKLTEEQKGEVLELLDVGVQRKTLAREYHVSVSTIGKLAKDRYATGDEDSQFNLAQETYARPSISGTAKRCIETDVFSPLAERVGHMVDGRSELDQLRDGIYSEVPGYKATRGVRDEAISERLSQLGLEFLKLRGSAGLVYTTMKEAREDMVHSLARVQVRLAFERQLRNIFDQ